MSSLIKQVALGKSFESTLICSPFSGTQSLKVRDPVDEGQGSGRALDSRGASHAKLTTLSSVPGTDRKKLHVVPYICSRRYVW